MAGLAAATAATQLQAAGGRSSGMCGIVGLYAYDRKAPAPEPSEALAIRDAMASRGPDGAGLWSGSDGRLVLAHRRLSILDLSEAGAQPMLDPASGNAIVFNGEIYNFRGLRRELEQAGERFRSESDTEILLALYRREGSAMLARLRGMFAFALWDARRRGLLLARDPLGIKPLYWSDHGGTLRVASQVKALAAGGGVPLEENPAATVGFHLLGYVPEPHCVWRALRALEPGHSLWVDGDGPRAPQAFLSLTGILAEAARGSPGPSPSAAFDESVLAHLVADVPVAVFLSAGLDSTTLASHAAAAGGTLHSLTLGFEELRGSAEDEVPLAERTAAALGSRHRSERVPREHFARVLPQLLQAMDQPSIDGANTYLVAEAARRGGFKVALSGLGADELLGGYRSFDQVPALRRLLRPLRPLRPLAPLYRRISAPLLSRLTSPKWAGLLDYGGSWGGAYLLRRGLYLPWELPDFLDPDLVREGWRELALEQRLERTAAGLDSDHQRMQALESVWYMRNQLLRDADWAGMAHSVEIRVPYVDLPLLHAFAPHLAGPTPPDKRSLARAAPRSLPPELLTRPKSGFVVPVRDWLLAGAGGEEAAELSRSRGLRGWARFVHSRYHRGGRGTGFGAEFGAGAR